MNAKKWLSGLLLVSLVGVGAVAAQGPFGGQRPADSGIAALLEAVSAETGLVASDLLLQLRDGQSLADIVAANNGDLQAVIDAAVAAATGRVNDMVANGRITQAQADTALASLTNMVTQAVNGELGFGRGMEFGFELGQHFGQGFGGRPGQGSGPMNGGQPGRGFGQGLFRGVEPLRFVGQRGLVDAVIEATDLDRIAIAEQLGSGLTLAEVVTAAGGDIDAIIDTAVANATETINQAVANERLTQAQADTLTAQLETHFTEMANTSVVVERLEHQLVREALGLAADQTGLTRGEIVAALSDGTTLADVLSENGVDVTAFVDELAQRAEARLNVLVADDQLTPERAAELLAALRAEIETRLNTPWKPETPAAAEAMI